MGFDTQSDRVNTSLKSYEPLTLASSHLSEWFVCWLSWPEASAFGSLLREYLWSWDRLQLNNKMTGFVSASTRRTQRGRAAAAANEIAKSTKRRVVLVYLSVNRQQFGLTPV